MSVSTHPGHLSTRDAEVCIAIARDPALVRTVRLVAAAVARRTSLQESLIEEIRLAIGEACAVLIGVDETPAADEKVEVTLRTEGAFAVEVRGRMDGADADFVDMGLDPWALLRGLCDDLEVTEEAGRTTLRMSWPA